MPKTKTQKREEAAERRQKYEARTAKEQLDLVTVRPGNSEREWARLCIRVVEESE